MHIYLYIKASLQHPGHFFCWRWTCSSETLGASPQPHRPSLSERLGEAAFRRSTQYGLGSKEQTAFQLLIFCFTMRVF